MQQKLSIIFSALLVAFVLLVPANAVANAQTSSARNCQRQAEEGGLGFLVEFPTWYKYLELDTKTCEVKNFEMPGDLWKVAIAVIEMLLRLAGLVAFVFVVISGYKFVLSRGNPSEAAKARQSLMDAIIGVAITSIAIVLVAFLGNQLK